MMISLDNEQQAAVMAASPTLVNASAGSGKTRCLIAKIQLLLERGVKPDNICAITFTNKAANEMKERLKKQTSIPIKGMQVSTIHSLCVTVIKTFHQHTYLDYPFSIYDEGDQLSVIKTIVKAREFKGDPKEYISLISGAKASQQEGLLKGDVEKVYKGYQDILFKNNACDFDDLLIFANDCLRHDDCKEYFTDLWHHVLVDEFQDTSKIQYGIVEQLFNKQKTQTLFVVGDFNQSIYSWRGANPSNINDFIKVYEPSVCNLTYNYRCSQAIIKHANNFLQFGETMTAKSAIGGKVSISQFDSQEDEAEKIAAAVGAMRGFETTAILFRVNARSMLFERVFSQRRIPYKVVGALPFYRRKVVKDILSAIKASKNRSDLESLVRIINIPKRGFGPKKQEALLNRGWPYLYEVAEEMPLIKGFIELLDEIKTMKPLEAVETFLFQTDYRDTITVDSSRLLLDSFLDVVSGFETLDELILASTFIEEDSGYGVKLMTAHASKGLEFDTVFVVGVESGLWPHKFAEDLDEEARLFYVACTRAKKYLNVSYSKTRLFRGQRIGVTASGLFLDTYRNLKS